ncbi:NADH dehydrogenase [ubiquinone] 1 beta subcomplex subunit 11, mitochondrial-like isoform X2 [Macrobrachium nipponense]|uniref:NADH dehydrogenase [ubiquinone] 1 beta subcomplex subunit 11, mitochondrial-like isoform X2 n=1 Tax=Macrobrachium nipponense TaxID=159736 RepID=UPI0030C7B0E1
MATLSRIGTVLLRHKSAIARPSGNVLRVASISTSKRNKDTITVTDAIPAESKSATEEVAVNKNWVSWGFSIRSETEDNTRMHLIFLFSVTLCLVTGGFIFAYMPDYKLRDWAQREAYLELRRREAEGLPLIDANLISADKVELPSDEDLGSTEIII